MIRDEIRSLTHYQAWEGYVGSQTPVEFMRYSREDGHLTVEAATVAYANDLPNLFPDECGDLTAEEKAAIADRLAEFIESQVE